MSNTHDEEIPVHARSGNIFADLGRPDAEEALARVRRLVQYDELRREIQNGCQKSYENFRPFVQTHPLLPATRQQQNP